MAKLHLRRIAVFVDEPDPGCFYWVLIESKYDASEWEDIGSSDESFDTWQQAWDAGNKHLLSQVTDPKKGPLVAGEDENSSPVG
ncbi:hypothetical protein [Polaromonas sp.]|uniref:hypothetical protein n=1 Tax=Polaromonas sp. TaxID=1869339 RepID=UPI002487C565|nr:hypothetical protein [Polaromonas sp.]MDI1272350.1 hypothetical protein [Polaromonas sp.]